mgnify:CR=1 FL=1
MPCCGICGNQGHNRRTCQQWQVLEANRRAEEEEEVEEVEEMSVIHTPPATFTDIRFNINYRLSTRNRSPVTSIAAITSIADTSVSFETPNDRNVSRSLIEELDNVDYNALFLDTDSDSDLDSLPGLISTDLLNDSMDKMVYPPLVNCVEEPCQIHDCPICMEDLKQTDLLITRCGHQFHGTCMLRHMKLHDNCPMCRGVLFTKAIAI